MKHKFLTILLTLIATICLTLGLVACGGNSGNTDSSGSDTEQGNTPKPDGDDKKPEEHVHSFTVENVCSQCGEIWEYTQGLEYQLIEVSKEDSKYYEGMFLEGYPFSTSAFYGVMGLGTASGDIVVPCGYQGKPVVGIRISGEDTLRSIEISDSVVSLSITSCPMLESICFSENNWMKGMGSDFGSIRDCPSLKSVEIPQRVLEISGGTFEKCNALAKIEIPDSVTGIRRDAFAETAYYKDATNWDENGGLYIGKHLIAVNNLSSDIVIRQGTKTIASGAFEDCTELEALMIPDSVTYIGASSFGYCSSLKSIVIPDSVTEIEGQAFFGCSSLENITLPDHAMSIGGSVFERTAYYNDTSKWDSNGVLYIGNHLIDVNENDNTLSQTFIIPANVKTIAGGAFNGCSSLRKIVIPDGVTSISECFWLCSNLTIEIPASVTLIKRDAFSMCRLWNIQYHGTIKEWEAVKKEWRWNDGSENYTVTCTDGTIDKEGNVTYFEQ